MEYRMDTAGILHMSARGNGKTNTFRLKVKFNEKISPERLDDAFRKTAERFPTITAGVRSGRDDHFVVPVKECPHVYKDRGALLYMPDDELSRCGMRVMYSDDSIIAEFFHPLTDGHGGITFTKALIDEYMGCSPVYSGDSDEETEDSFIKYAGEKKLPMNKTVSFLPARDDREDTIRITTGIFNVNDLLRLAHEHDSSLTVFLTAVMAESLAEMQEKHGRGKKHPIQIMVPVNLRNIFPSRSVKNFSLYALTRTEPEKIRSLSETAADIGRQMKEQLGKERLASMMAANTVLKTNTLLKKIPLKVKCFAVKTGFMLLGEKTSALTFSNLGKISFNESYADKIVRADFILSPRLNSAYNCAVISCNDTVCVNFSRTCREPMLERIFFRRLKELGAVPTVESDGEGEELKI